MRDSDERRAVAASFKPIEGGYLYRAPSGWTLWRRLHFVVDADLRERLIAAQTEPRWVTRLWLLVPFLSISIASVFALAYYFGEMNRGHPFEFMGATFAFTIVGLAAGCIALSEHQWRRVAPLLRTARPSKERISHAELAAAVRAAVDPS